MASSVLAIPSSYHKPIPAVRTSKLATTDVRSEDELLKFFLHGSYDVQRGNTRHCQTNETTEKAVCIKKETTTDPIPNSDEKKGNNRCMFEETYMINISVKQPNMTPASKQIDVRIQKTPSDTHSPCEKNTDAAEDDDEISSIFDEDDNDEVDSVVFNESNAPTTEVSSTKLTLADMINKTLTTISTPSADVKTNGWYVEQPTENQARKKSEDIIADKMIRTPPPPTLTTDINEDTKLIEYLDYLETKEDVNQPIRTSPISTTKSTPKPTPSATKPSSEQDVLPIVDLEQLCRSLTVSDLKDELIRKKIYELKLLIDEQHRRPKSQLSSMRPKKDNLPILIAMPPVIQQHRRRTTALQPTTNVLLQSKTVNLQAPYQGLPFNYQKTPSPNQQQPRRAMPPGNTNYKYQRT